jgi:predicted nucleotidyltransferase
MPLVDIEKVLGRLIKNEVQFVIIGGVATTLHGLPHSTYDLDICYERSPKNIERLARSLRGWHPRLRGVANDVPFLFDTRTILAGLNFTLTTDIGDLDLFGEVAGIGGYSDVEKHSEVMDVFGMKCNSLSIEGLIKSKKATRREKDLGVLTELQALLEMKRKK